uniref:TOG domain-containing protein n=1 Tax=Ditylenchus dipsaci TaxID=166011 RepID=A0A915EMA3_9BILA
MSFLDPVDALLDSKKWSERRDSLECLLELLGQYGSQLSPTADYSDLCKSLKRDSNINVVSLAVKVVGALATGLGTRKKEVLKKPLIECVDHVSLSCTNIEKFLPAMLDDFLSSQFFCSTASAGISKSVLPVIAKQTEEGDPDVRDSAFAAMGSAQRLVGEAGMKAIAACALGDPNKAKKVATYCESATKEAEEYRIAMGEKLPADFSDQLASKAWAERRDALQVLLTLLEQNHKLVADTSLYKELVTQIVKILEKDTNINAYDSSFLTSPLLQFLLVWKNSKRKSGFARTFAACADAIALTTSIAEYTEKITVGLTKSNPTVKQQTALFLNRLFKKHNSKTCPAAAVKELSATLTKILEEYQKLLAELGNKANPLIIKLHANSSSLAHNPQPNLTQKPSAASSRTSSAQKPSATVRRVNSSASAHTTRPIASANRPAAVVSQSAKPKSATPARVTSATSSILLPHPPPVQWSCASPLAVVNNLPDRCLPLPDQLLMLYPSKQNGNAVKEMASVLARSIPPAPGAVGGGSRISRPPSSSCLASMAKANSGQVSRSTSSVGTSRIPRLGSRPTTPSNRLS